MSWSATTATEGRRVQSRTSGSTSRTRSAKRTMAAALGAAVSMVDEADLPGEPWSRSVRPQPTRSSPDARPHVGLVRGGRDQPGTPRQAQRGSQIVSARQPRPAGPQDVVLVRWKPTPDDIHGMIASASIPCRRRHDLARRRRRAGDGRSRARQPADARSRWTTRGTQTRIGRLQLPRRRPDHASNAQHGPCHPGLTSRNSSRPRSTRDSQTVLV